MYSYLLAFGSNMGDRHSHLHQGLNALAAVGQITAQSRWLETAPLPHKEFDTQDHGVYVNFVIEFRSPLTPPQLYAKITDVEDREGHPRERRWLPRALDIDILFASKGPHPRFADNQPLPPEEMGELNIPHLGFWDRDFLVDLVLDDLKISHHLLLSHSKVPT